MPTEVKPKPGLPPQAKLQFGIAAERSEAGTYNSEGRTLWTLFYIKSNSVRFTILSMDSSLTLGESVEAAQIYCKRTLRVVFSWLEPMIVELNKQGEIENRD
jgi:hypothetical protein